MIKIAPYILYRIPQFPMNANIETYWPALKEIIREASPTLFSEIKNINVFSIDKIKPSLAQSIWKYMNRCQYRCTPYGSLAAFAMLDLRQILPNNGTMLIRNYQCLHQYPDWTLIPSLGNLQVTNKSWSNTKVVSNSSYYKVGDSIRYLVHDNGQFQLAETAYSEELAALLARCRKATSFSELENEFGKENKEKLKKIIDYLIDNQLLYTNCHSNIIGQDFFERISYQADKSTTYYQVAERRVISGGPDIRLFRYLPLMVKHLTQLTQHTKSSRLDDFRHRFLERYEMREVLLLEALDPEIGIGYGDMSNESAEEDIINDLMETSQKETTKSIEGSEFWLKAIANLNGAGTLDLETLSIKKELNESPLPNTLSMLCHLTNDQVILDHFGGSTAISLAGRFSLASGEVTQMCRELAQIESDANPSVLFFDISYQAEGRVDNVNRRSSIYSHQLSIFDYDTSDTPLWLNDLYLCVQGNQLVIRSKNLDKRLIPRLASAYNYERSDLPVFCFLCDVQHQGVNSNIWPGLTNLVPGLDRYPEVRYRNFVLSPRAWKIPSKFDVKSLSLLIDSILESGCNFVKMGMSDQKLHFDLHKRVDRDMLVALAIKDAKKGLSNYIQEWHRPNKSHVTDESGNEFASELHLSLNHTNQIFNGIMSPNAMVQPTHEHYSLPGDKWLYWEIYAHPQKIEIYLQTFISYFLRKHHQHIKRYFFVRYAAGGEHLRLRLELFDSLLAGQISSSFSEAVRDEINSGSIQQLKVGTYRRELERYGSDIMDQVEDWFYLDSKFILMTLAAELPRWSKYQCTLFLMESMIHFGAVDKECLKSVVDKSRENLLQEYRLQPNSYRMMNGFFGRYNSEQQEIPSDILATLKELAIKLADLINLCSGTRRKRRLLSDLIHMHVNRQFTRNQRLHEALIYHFEHRIIMADKRFTSSEAG
ncbi:lantibiotic dehydratase [Sphingobacterium sp. KU25419]|nr:lantibiotic dehydratase [Sphingobacterium sp. KU25419]